MTEGIDVVKRRSAKRLTQKEEKLLIDASIEASQASQPWQAPRQAAGALRDLSSSIQKVQADFARVAECLTSAHDADCVLPGDSHASISGLAQAVDDAANSPASHEASADCKDFELLSPSHRAYQVNAETLPETWPTSLSMRWEVSGEMSHDRKVGLNTRLTKAGLMMEDVELSRMLIGSREAAGIASRWRHRLVFHPNSTFRMVYDVFSACLLACDMIWIPMVVAWEIPLEGYMLYVTWITAAFWTFDILLSFQTGFQYHGEVVLDRSLVAKHYLTGWFLPDVTIVTCDWISSLILSSSGWRMLRMAKIGRLLRLLSMFRMLKIGKVFEEIIETRMSDVGKLVIRFVKMMLITMGYAHLSACTWYFIGRLGDTNTGMRWIDFVADNGRSQVAFIDTDLSYQYFTSFHWAVSQITLGAMEVVSTTSFERGYTIFCLVSGLLFGSTLVSSLSATMLEVQMDKRDSYLKMQQMRQFLRENKVSRETQVQVEKQLTERLSVKVKLKEDQVEGLKLISSAMRTHIRFEMFSQHMRSYPLFRLWINIDTEFMKRVCRESVHVTFLRNQDDLFTAGKAADDTYYLMIGRLTYTQEPESSPVDETSSREVTDPCWLAEAALWTQWIHVGNATASLYSEVAEVRVSEIMVHLQRATTILNITEEYCRSFHRRLQAAVPPASAWPDDLQVPQTDWSDLVLSLSRETQTVIGLDALREAAESRKWSKSATGMDKLGLEVESGKSTVMLNALGEIERVVSLVAMKLCNEQDQMFIQICKLESGQMSMKPACQLPGRKQDRGELVIDTFDQLLANKLNVVSHDVEVTHTEREFEHKESKEFGVRTKYQRNIVCCRLMRADALEPLRIPATDLHSPDYFAISATMGRVRSIRDGGIHAFSEWRHPLSPTEGLFGRVKSAASATGSPSNMGRQDTNGSHMSREPSINWSNVLSKRDTFLITDSKGGASMYAWLSKSEFEQLKGPRSEDILSQWVESLNDEVDLHNGHTNHAAERGASATAVLDRDRSCSEPKSFVEAVPEVPENEEPGDVDEHEVVDIPISERVLRDVHPVMVSEAEGVFFDRADAVVN